jgi:YaiO family outer membrane protein
MMWIICIAGILTGAEEPAPEPPPGPTLEDALALKQAQKLPEAEALLLTLAARGPDDPAVLTQLATVQGWQSKLALSTETWRKVVALRPDDPDARVGLARVLYWSEQRAESIRQLERALSLRPDMPDALALLGDVHRADGSMGAARAAYEKARAAGDTSPELAKKIELAVPPPVVRADTGATYDLYSPGNPAGRSREWSAFAQVGAALGAFTPSLRFENFHYFGNTDNTFTAGLVYRLSKDAALSAELGLTPDLSEFRPKWLATLSGEAVIAPQVAVLATYRHMYFYEFGHVDLLLPALRIQLSPGLDAQLGGAVAHNADDTVTGAFVGRLTYSFQDFLFPYVAASYGQESLPPLAIANTAVVAAGVVWNITPRISARADYAHEHRTSLFDTLIYDHDSIGAALTLKL